VAIGKEKMKPKKQKTKRKRGEEGVSGKKK